MQAMEFDIAGAYLPMQELSVRRVSTFTASRYIEEAITCVRKGVNTMMHLIATIKTIITPKLA